MATTLAEFHRSACNNAGRPKEANQAQIARLAQAMRAFLGPSLYAVDLGLTYTTSMHLETDRQDPDAMIITLYESDRPDGRYLKHKYVLDSRGLYWVQVRSDDAPPSPQDSLFLLEDVARKCAEIHNKK